MRLPALTELTPRQQEVSDAIAAKRGATRGPFLIWLRSPELAAKVDALGAYCRFEASINERLRELSLLIAARHFDAQYSWNAHHKKAIEAGVTAESVKELAGNEVPHFAQNGRRAIGELSYQSGSLCQSTSASLALTKAMEIEPVARWHMRQWHR